MTTPIHDEAAWLESLGANRRARFLASLSHNLTIAIRVLCHTEPAEQCIERVRLLNEAHHRVSSYLSHYHIGDEDSLWIRAVVEYVLDSTEPVVFHHAQQAWHFSKNAMSSLDA